MNEEKHKVDSRSWACADGKHPSEAKLELEHSNRSDEDVAYIDSDEMSHGCLRGPVLRALGFLADMTDDKRPEYYSEEDFKEAKYLAKSLHDKVYAFDYTCL